MTEKFRLPSQEGENQEEEVLPISFPIQALHALSGTKRYRLQPQSLIRAGAAVMLVSGLAVTAWSAGEYRKFKTYTPGDTAIPSETIPVLPDRMFLGEKTGTVEPFTARATPLPNDGTAPELSDFSEFQIFSEVERTPTPVREPYEYEGIRFDLPVPITIRFSFTDEVRGKPDWLEITFIPRLKLSEVAAEKGCDGLGIACVMSFNGNIGIEVGSGKTYGEDPEELPAEGWRAYLEGQRPFARLSVEKQKKRLERLLESDVSISQGDVAVSGLKLEALVRIPPQDVEKHNQSFADAFRVAAKVDPQALANIDDSDERLVVFTTCGWYDPQDEVKPENHAWYQWSRLFGVLQKEKMES